MASIPGTAYVAPYKVFTLQLLTWLGAILAFTTNIETSLVRRVATTTRMLTLERLDATTLLQLSQVEART